MSDTPMILCEGLGKRFGDRWVLRGVDLALHQGDILGVIGPGGHGKSVLLKLMAGLLVPDEGRVQVKGHDLSDLDALGLAQVRNDFGYLFQNYALFDFMTVADNVAFPLRQQGGMTEAAIADAVRARLTEVGLGHTLQQYPRELSGGMKKRVGLARATITEPRLVFYDDPSAGLDPVTSSKIFQLIAGMCARQEAGATVVISHDIDRMKAVCTRYLMLLEGEVVFDGVESAMAGAHETVNTFFHGAAGLP